MVARILRRCGLFIGAELNESEDAWRFGDYSDRWINVYLSHGRNRLPGEVEHEMLDDLADILTGHCGPIAHQPRMWGWKEPRSIYLLPFFHRHFPAFRFLHVIRDGRDMALSTNQNQLRKHGGAAGVPTDLVPAARSMSLWSWINLKAARYGEAQLGDRYLRIRFEDLCSEPVETAHRILAFFELDGDPTVAVDEVAAPCPRARWHAEPAAVVAELERVGGEALVVLGYERMIS